MLCLCFIITWIEITGYSLHFFYRYVMTIINAGDTVFVYQKKIVEAKQVKPNLPLLNLGHLK